MKRKLAHNPLGVFMGSKLRALRINNNLSQKDIGYICGVSSQQISKYELGYNALSVAQLYILHQEFGIEINYFFPSFEDE